MDAWVIVIWIICFIGIFVHCSNAEYQCYKWTAEDQREMGSKPSTAKEKAQCEKRYGNFTKGFNGNYPGCGTCWCCENATSSFAHDQGTANVMSMLCSLLQKFMRKPGFNCNT